VSEEDSINAYKCIIRLALLSIGALHQSDQTSTSGGSILIDEERLYCRFVSLPFFRDPLIRNWYLQKSTNI